jgi:hypothetical protein
MPADDHHGRPAVRGLPGGPGPSLTAGPASVTDQLQDVDDALTQLADLPVDAQVAGYADLHQRLTAALAVTATAAGSTEEPSGHRSGPGRPSR